jgi:hypothetical protein
MVGGGKMKIRNNLLLIAALILAVFILGACSFLDGSDSLGSIIINFDNSSARAVSASGYVVDETGMIYTITLTSPGKNTITRTTDDTSISIPVSEGTWKIEVKAKGEGRVSEGKGEESVVVTAGKPAPANIGMNVTGTRVSSWRDLYEDFTELELKDGKLKYLNNIEIKDDFTATTTYTNRPSTDLNMSGYLHLNAENNNAITLWAVNTGVTISKGSSNDRTLFTIEKGTLILDGTQGGDITLLGNLDTGSQRAIINVTSNGTLIMHNRVTLSKNVTAYGGGVWVKGGRFEMHGGTISGNHATINGGGVFIHDDGGTFIKTGGIIYGNDNNGSNSNKADGSGHTVYDGSNKSNPKIWDDILDSANPNGNWPKP